MPLTADQAKAAASEAVLSGVQNFTAALFHALASGDRTQVQGSADAFAAGLACARQAETLAHRLIEKAFEPETEETKGTESDDDYRSRLAKIIGPSSIHYARVQKAVGREIDSIGANYDVKRK